MADALEQLESEVTDCRRCPRLVAWREEVAQVKRRAFIDEEYWGRPMPGFGDPAARIVVLGLAPAAHGGNRTGRIFTGDRSGDWLFAALWRAGLANQPTSVSRDDGLTLDRLLGDGGGALRPAGQQADAGGARQLLRLAARRARAAPERARDRLPRQVRLGCRPWRSCQRRGLAAASATASRRPSADVTLLGSYHVSQQNTFTGRLTEPMLDAVFARARELAGPA